nr:MAG TPA: hypothetical protein [Caudoviricetes sp.]
MWCTAWVILSSKLVLTALARRVPTSLAVCKASE